MDKKQGLWLMMAGLAIAGCTRETYDFTPYNTHYSDTEMLYESGYIVRDSGESMPYQSESMSAVPLRSAIVPTTTEVKVVIPQGDDVWVSEQPKTAYTIELIQDSQPAVVANQLLRAPTSGHHAFYRYVKNGTTHYLGLYGSYTTHEAAQVAMDALPDQLKMRATIKRFNALKF